jgi:CRISPR-associated protein Cmr5
MIQTNGLGATLAFLRAKAGTDHAAADYRLYEHIATRIVYYLEYTAGDVMHLIREADTDTYRRATAEAIAFSIWLKRYVEAEGWKASN